MDKLPSNYSIEREIIPHPVTFFTIPPQHDVLYFVMGIKDELIIRDFKESVFNELMPMVEILNNPGLIKVKANDIVIDNSLLLTNYCFVIGIKFQKSYNKCNPIPMTEFKFKVKVKQYFLTERINPTSTVH